MSRSKSQQLGVEEAIWRQVQTEVDNKEIYANEDEMPLYSLWHRYQLPDSYPWTDIDYVGFDFSEKSVYAVLEFKELPEDQFEPFNPTEAPKEDSTQLAVYHIASIAFSAPAYLVWYCQDIDPHDRQSGRFKIDPIKKRAGVVDYWKDGRIEISGMHRFADFLDSLKRGDSP